MAGEGSGGGDGGMGMSSEGSGSMSTSGSLSSVAGSVNMVVPMPIPHDEHAPYFDGERVQDFLDSLEQHADRAKIPHTQLPGYVPRYCAKKVRHVVEHAPAMQGSDWVAARTLLIELYGSNDLPPKTSASRLRAWTKKHGSQGIISSLQDVDEYYRNFTQLANPLTMEPRQILENDLNMCFYKGIPETLRKRIRKRIPTANQKITNPPSVEQLLAWLRKEFDVTDIDADLSDVDLDLGQSSSESDEDSEREARKAKRVRRKKKKTKKSVTFASEPSIKTIPTVRESEERISELTRGIEQLRIAVAEATRGRGENIVRESYVGQAANHRCGMCGHSGRHPPGYNNCSETHKLLDEEFIKYDQRGRIVMTDGSELPPPTNEIGGVAQKIRNLRASRTEAKGKTVVGRDIPPHMATTKLAGLLLDGRDVLSDGAFGVSTVEVTPAWRAVANPATRSHKEDSRFDPKKRPTSQASPNDPTHIPRALREEGKEKGKETEEKRSTAPKPHESRAPQHPTLPAVNTREGTKRKGKTGNGKEEDNSKSRPQASYHFTSTVQEKVNLEELEGQLLDKTMITMTLGQFLGCSPEFQRRMANLTKTRRKYTDKPVMVSRVEECDEEICPCGCMESRLEEVEGDEEELEYVGSRVEMEYDPERITKEAVEVRYASAVKLHKNPMPLFAMVTGKFAGTFGGVRVTFMVDTGSELNLCPGDLYTKTELSLDLDGTRWSLRGIHGAPVRLAGCARDVPIQIGGHAFDHHFFVNGAVRGSEEAGDVILGQPWLQWYTAGIQYDREGGMTMRVWQNGYKGDRATLSIPLTRPDADRNKASLVVEPIPGHRCKRHPRVEDGTDEEAGN